MSTDPYATCRRNVRTLMRKHGMSQKHLAACLGIDPASVSRLVGKNARDPFGEKNRIRLEILFGLQPGQLGSPDLIDDQLVDAIDRVKASLAAQNISMDSLTANELAVMIREQQEQ